MTVSMYRRGARPPDDDDLDRQTQCRHCALWCAETMRKGVALCSEPRTQRRSVETRDESGRFVKAQLVEREVWLRTHMFDNCAGFEPRADVHNDHHASPASAART